MKCLNIVFKAMELIIFHNYTFSKDLHTEFLLCINIHVKYEIDLTTSLKTVYIHNFLMFNYFSSLRYSCTKVLYYLCFSCTVIIELV